LKAILKHRWLVVGTLIVTALGAAPFLFELGVLTGETGGYVVSDTGIRQKSPMNFSWCDSEHVVIARDRADMPERHELIYIDIRNPTDIHVIDLRNSKVDDPNTIARIYGLTCINNDILFFGRTLAPRGEMESPGRIYFAHPNKTTELLVALKEERGGRVPLSIKNKYVVGNGNLSTADPPGSITRQCADYISSDYKLLCWETLNSNVWPLTKFVLATYRWDESFILQDHDGMKKHARNPTPPLIGENGKPIVYALFLRDFEGNVIARLDKDPNFAAFNNLLVDKNESYVYATCRRRSEPPNRWNSMCRYALNGESPVWEEVFVFEPRDKSFISIEGLSTLSDEGNLAFYIGLGHPGIWIYEARSKVYKKITSIRDDMDPKIAGNGKSVLFLRREEGIVKLMIGQRRDN